MTNETKEIFMNPDRIEFNKEFYVKESTIKPTTIQDVDHPYEIGKNIAIRTVTMIQVGKLVGVYKQELVLEDAAWIPETDRFSDFIANGSHKECEPFAPGFVIVGRGSVIDAQHINWSAPRSKK